MSLALPFPEVSTGYGVVSEGTRAYAPLTPLTEPGGFLLLAVLVTWLVCQANGYSRAWQEKTHPRPVWWATAADSLPAATAVTTFLVLASVMSHSGQTEVLALGIAAVEPPVVYAFLANVIGVVGALVTNSSTSSNVLFAPVQTTVAAQLGMDQARVLAAQSAGAEIGNVVAPTNIIPGTTTTGIRGQDDAVLRKTIPGCLSRPCSPG